MKTCVLCHATIVNRQRNARKLAYIKAWQARNRSDQRGYQRAYYHRHKWGT